MPVTAHKSAARVISALRSAAGGTVVIDPVPESWAALKPSMLELLSSDWARSPGRPKIVGYPLCALGESWRALSRLSGPARVRHPACQVCSLAEHCSPPRQWNAAELQPFGPRSPIELWQRFHARYARALGIAQSPLADRIVAAHAPVVAASPDGIWELEPSLVVTDRVKPELRLVMFHGPLPEDPAVAVSVTRRLLSSWLSLHEIVGSKPPRELAAVLEAHAPYELPCGFELQGDALMLKAYARVRHFAVTRREALCRDLAAQVDRAAERLKQVESMHPSLWRDLEMLGFASARGRLVALKLYIRRDAREGWAELGLSAIPSDHPFQLLSRNRSYAVIDLVHPKPRAHKWDYYLRERLLSGPMLASFAQRMFSAEASERLTQIVSHHEFHVDVVAAALRDDAWVFYCALN